ncbi:MAG: hypothetical protein HDQ98_02135 [Lachnospiraceae bacterium]|nr:hypothetical protein [Lachnospiraceae bacterium]
MINSSLEAQEKVDALIIYKFLVLYNAFENCIRDIFSKEWNSMDSAIKNRIAYYVGWLGSVTKYIEYDTYSVHQEANRYDEEMLIKKLTINQIIRIDRKEKVISNFSFDILSKIKKQLTFLSHESFLCLISMRNKLAHNILQINFRNSDIIELLPNSIIEKDSEFWIRNIDLTKLSDSGRAILSNYIFMKEILVELRKDGSYEY